MTFSAPSFFSSGAVNLPFSRTYTVGAAALAKGPIQLATVYQAMVLLGVVVRPQADFTYSANSQIFGVHAMWLQTPALLDGAGCQLPQSGGAGCAYMADLQNVQVTSKVPDALVLAVNSAWIGAMQPGDGLAGTLCVDVVGYIPGKVS